MVYSADKVSPSFLRNGPLYPTEFQIQEKLPVIETYLIKDTDTRVLAVPVYDSTDVSSKLLNRMFEDFNQEIITGGTYPQYERFANIQDYTGYWFNSFCCILIKKPDNIDKSKIFEYIKNDEFKVDWEDNYLGTFYIKPNYVGRCSQVCNAGFFVPVAHRSKKIGYRLGQIYLKYAPKLGYSQSIFNLVYTSNVGSWKTWDKLKFARIGVVPKVAILGANQKAIEGESVKKYKYEYTDAYIYSKDLLSIEEELFNDM